MNIREEEEKLFQNWKENRPHFVYDGVISESDYLPENPKIVFVLKEVNSEEYEWDLRDYVSKGGRPQTWNNIARWVHGINNIHSMKNWEFYEKISEEEEISKEFRIQNLNKTCALNLKKSPGTHTTDQASLHAAANEDREYIQKQYSLYDPDITICGGIGDLFRDVVDHGSMEWQMTERGIWWYEREPNKCVISYVHPEARVKDSLLFYGLIDAVSEILAKRK